MKTFAAILILILLAAFGGAAQEKCVPPNAPSVFGLKLNMSPEQAQSVVGKSIKIKIKKSDQKTIFQNYIKEPPPPNLSGVRALYLRFYDRSLYQIEFFYEDESGINTLEDFTDRLSARFGYPASIWEKRAEDSIIKCGEYTIVADKILNPRVELTDETARAKVARVREEKKRK